jgi:hypothetical protein
MNDLEKDKRKKQAETINGVNATWFSGVGHDPEIVFFEKDNTLVFTTSLDAAKAMLAAWEGKNKKTLSENPTYATVMSRCRGSRDETPQILFYLDIQNYLKMMEKIMSGEGAIMMAMMPALGLDGLLGIGGGVVLDDSRFDSVIHAHLALDNPRSGVLKVIALKPGPTKPEYWVPADAVNYTTFHWDFQKSVEALAKVIDSYMGEGTTKRYMTEEFKRRSNVDLEKDVLPTLDGRVTMFSWIQRPITEDSNQSVIALKLKDVEKIKQATDRLGEANPFMFTKANYAGRTYYYKDLKKFKYKPGPFEYTCFGIVDDYLVWGSLPPIYEKVLLTAAQGKTSLGDEPDFKLVMSKIQRLSGEAPPAMVAFERQDERLRYFYDLALSEGARKGMKKEAEHNPFFKWLNTGMESNPLPPFEALRKYLAPGGSIIIDDETGIHYMYFTLKRKPE